jgi:uncharacterized C2H2 Zn-finger protein
MVHICPACHAVFGHKSSLERHIHCVHSLMRYQCPRCEATYRRKVDLSYHCAEIHSTYICWHEPKLSYFNYVRSVIFMDHSGIILEGRNPRYGSRFNRRPTTDAETQVDTPREEGRPTLVQNLPVVTQTDTPCRQSESNSGMNTPDSNSSNSSKKKAGHSASCTITRPLSVAPLAAIGAPDSPAAGPSSDTCSTSESSKPAQPSSHTVEAATAGIIIPGPTATKTSGFKRPNVRKTVRKAVNFEAVKKQIEEGRSVSNPQPTPSTSNVTPLESYQTAEGAATDPSSRKRTAPKKLGKKAQNAPPQPPFVARQIQPCGSLNELLTPKAPVITTRPGLMTKSAGQIRREFEEREARLSLLEQLQVSSSDEDEENGETGEKEKKTDKKKRRQF